MKHKVVILFLLLIPMVGMAQRYTVEGLMQITHFYQGGVENVEKPVPTVLPNTSLKVVRFTEGDSIPKVIKKVRSDESGKFTIELKPGKYGFVGVKDKVEANQYVPRRIQNSRAHERHSSQWELAVNGQALLQPFEVTDTDLKLTITQHQRTICFLCP